MRLTRLAAAVLVLGGLAAVLPGADMPAPDRAAAYPADAPPPLWSALYLSPHGAPESQIDFDGGIGGPRIVGNASRVRKAILSMAGVSVSGRRIEPVDTGGFAWTIEDAGTSGSNARIDHRTGAGLAWIVTPAWTARAQYLTAHFGSQTAIAGTGDVVRFAADAQVK